jgi:hypothetical protein
MSFGPELNEEYLKFFVLCSSQSGKAFGAVPESLP